MGAPKKAVTKEVIRKVRGPHKIVKPLTPAEIEQAKKLKPNTPITVNTSKDANVFKGKRAWILKEIPTGENQIDQYQITFGKGKERAVLAMTAIHAACLVR